ncbi:MAG TPA: 2-C-methyl-D-erythritol 4-phosphate cytidylyltransferase [Gemmatimonadales bacterium]|nr:2-C-methyl-D-erythritol 4-phosphate cytidylyltransferase [Gemmatimonadales bacterium]
MPRDVGVVVVAAGKSERMGGEVPKQFRSVAGVPLLLRAVRPFLSHPDVNEVVVVLPAAHIASPPGWLAELLGERLRAVAGGASRMDSVEAGLLALVPECRVVLVHDGARPFPEPTVIDRVIAAVRHGTGAIAAVPVTDTLKEGEPPALGALGHVIRTVSRERLWRAQTPQGFPRAMLMRAFSLARTGGYLVTDEAGLLERAGDPVVLVHDVTTNLKITTPEDLRLAEALATAGS